MFTLLAKLHTSVKGTHKAKAGANDSKSQAVILALLVPSKQSKLGPLNCVAIDTKSSPSHLMIFHRFGAQKLTGFNFSGSQTRCTYRPYPKNAQTDKQYQIVPLHVKLSDNWMFRPEATSSIW